MASATVALSSVPSSSAAPSSYGPAIGESLTSSTTQPNTESTGAVTSIDLSPASRSSFGKSAAIGGAISAACILALVVAAVVLRRTKIRKRTIKKPIANDTVHMASIIVPYAIIGDDQPESTSKGLVASVEEARHVTRICPTRRLYAFGNLITCVLRLQNKVPLRLRFRSRCDSGSNAFPYWFSATHVKYDTKSPLQTGAHSPDTSTARSRPSARKRTWKKLVNSSSEVSLGLPM
ncbi:hypothetical protein C8Q70DRAFT_423973 [Cubamyces menziesii]|nr:hypothetical protein C8Q70DRAFT_423973 [Cubamyces menziesii]